ncbi:OmpA family protein [candidate division GN15 bacterium]|nr:OmpA family protein [candidate division GN15 bacterium]
MTERWRKDRFRMKTTLILALVAMLMFAAGCGVNKEFVQEQIAASESRTGSQISSLRDKTDANETQIAQLKQLAQEIEGKADKALNEAAGFENYQILWSGEINFAFDSYKIDEVAASILDEAGMKLEQNAGAVITMAGHTDRTGSQQYNMMLGDQRARSAKGYLADKFGISLYRMFTITHGEDKPVAMPDERNASSRNRRVVLQVWGTM